MKTLTRRVVPTFPVAALLLLGGLSGATRVQAQTPQSPQDFEKTLGITADQRTKMDAVKAKYGPKIQAINQKYQPQFDALKARYGAEMKPLYDQANKETEAVFTPAQREKIKKYKAAMMAQQQQLMGARPGGVSGAMAPKK